MAGLCSAVIVQAQGSERHQVVAELIYTLSQSETANASRRARRPTSRKAIPLSMRSASCVCRLRMVSSKGDQILVAVIDSGVDTTHPEFAGVIADTYDVLDPAEPPHAHGTAIAGAIAAHSRLMGVAPSAKILAIRAFGEFQRQRRRHDLQHHQEHRLGDRARTPKSSI